jgi:hypothetical protein
LARGLREGRKRFMQLKIDIHANIKKPLNQVFDAVYNPKKLSVYFTTGGDNDFIFQIGKEE